MYGVFRTNFFISDDPRAVLVSVCVGVVRVVRLTSASFVLLRACDCIDDVIIIITRILTWLK
jgi:hypothetical protein